MDSFFQDKRQMKALFKENATLKERIESLEQQLAEANRRADDKAGEAFKYQNDMAYWMKEGHKSYAEIVRLREALEKIRDRPGDITKSWGVHARDIAHKALAGDGQEDGTQRR